jgi:hypothetical protein
MHEIARKAKVAVAVGLTSKSKRIGFYLRAKQNVPSLFLKLVQKYNSSTAM